MGVDGNSSLLSASKLADSNLALSSSRSSEALRVTVDGNSSLLSASKLADSNLALSSSHALANTLEPVWSVKAMRDNVFSDYVTGGIWNCRAWDFIKYIYHVDISFVA